MNFFKVLPNLKMSFSVVFKLTSKLESFPVAAIDMGGARFILTIPDT